MIPKKAKVVLTFHTTTDAMAMESLCRKQNLGGRMIPVPGDVTADCGLAFCAEPGMEETLIQAANAAGIPCQGVYHLMI
ncbi:MAG: DUF3343 domain-containing protein [Candidatus Ventricola sp.]